MTKLIERYVVAALERTPEDQRKDVGREIRGAVDEIVERRIDAGEPEEQAVRSALDELGDPVRLAASYHDHKRYLIGPGWYSAYIDVLKRVLAVALPLIAAIVVALEIAEDDASIVNAIGAGLGSIFDVGLQVVFWVTLAFVIAERTMGSDGPPSRKRTWSVDDLPETSLGRQVGLADTLFTVLSLGLFGILAFVFHERALGRIIDNVGNDVSSIPLLNPHLGLGWVVVFYALVSLSIVVAVDRYFVGFWTRPMFVVSVAENAFWIAFAIALASSEQIVNPEFARRVDESNPDRWSAGGQVNQVAAAVVIAISIWDLWEGWQGNRAYERDRQLTSAAA